MSGCAGAFNANDLEQVGHVYNPEPFRPATSNRRRCLRMSTLRCTTCARHQLEDALILILDTFYSVCASGAIFQGRTNCFISDFTRLYLLLFLQYHELATQSARQVSAIVRLKRMEIAVLQRG